MGYDPEHDHQTRMTALTTAFERHDAARLARLSEEDLEKQRDARWELYKYIDYIWEEAKHNGLDPANDYPEWNAVAALRDFFLALGAAADRVSPAAP